MSGVRFVGTYGGSRQARPFKGGKPLPAQERLAAMREELENRRNLYGHDHLLTKLVEQQILKLEEERAHE